MPSEAPRRPGRDADVEAAPTACAGGVTARALRNTRSARSMGFETAKINGGSANAAGVEETVQYALLARVRAWVEVLLLRQIAQGYAELEDGGARRPHPPQRDHPQRASWARP